jgi:glycosyltransferase involved in cell wall biosynthesis
VDNNIKDRNIMVDKIGGLRIVYTGLHMKNRGLESLTDVVKEMADVQLVTAGPVFDKEIFLRMQEVSNITYVGLLKPKDAISLEFSADAMIALYNTDIVWNRITLPNKIFEAMMCGIPIITNVATEIVNETQCGIIVDYNNIDQIKSAIIRLRENQALRGELGSNGRKAFLRRYNWGIMEQELFRIYDNLLKVK